MGNGLFEVLGAILQAVGFAGIAAHLLTARRP